MTIKLKNLVKKPTLDYILTRDKSILDKAEEEYAKSNQSEENFFKIIREYGAILVYEPFEKTLKKKDRKYFNHLKKELKEKKENAEVDIDYLEKIIPFMKTINIMTGVYNKEYSLDDKEVLEFEAMIQTGKNKPIIIKEKITILPYNLRMNKAINPSA